MNAIWWALASMLCAAVNDFIFKLYARRGGSIGAYLALIGVIWTVVFVNLAWADGAGVPNAAAWRWGLISGVFSILANILLLAGMARIDVGVAATVYRLNLAPAAVVAVLAFNETVSFAKAAALICAAVAVVLVCRPGRRLPAGPGVGLAPDGVAHTLDVPAHGRPGHPALDRFGLALVIAACLLRAGMGVSYKAGLLAGADVYVMAALNGLAWVAGGVFYHRCAGAHVPVGTGVLAFGVPSGVLVCGIVLFMMLALRVGEASIVLPVAQLSFVVTSLLGVVILRETLTGRKLAGIALAGLCVVLLAWRGVTTHQGSGFGVQGSGNQEDAGHEAPISPEP